MPLAPMSARTTRILRVLMLVVIALVALANAAGVDGADADLWIPFVCIIAVMGVGTRGGPVDALGFVLIEASVVVLLGVATFSGSRDGVWVASVGISVLAIGKIALVEMHRMDAAHARRAEAQRSGEFAALSETGSRRKSESESSEVSPEPLASESSVNASSVVVPAETGFRAKAERAAIPRTISELPPAPVMNPAPQQHIGPPALRSEVVAEPTPRKKRDRNDPTPRAVPLDRPR